MDFETLPEYDRDLKNLLKKYRTLVTDIEDVKKVLEVRPDAHPPFSFRIDGLGIESCVIKVKKIASDSFKGKGKNAGFRLVYAYFQEIGKIILVELYHKNEKQSEDRERILANFK
jgi:mRNA-degrading endonuclease RelE of RelBE toxin-antitoxin system